MTVGMTNKKLNWCM